MTETAHLHLPLIEASQAQKHVTHNEALQILDAVIQIAVQDRNRTTPPSSPAEGVRHVVAAGAGGAWAGQDQAIATWQGGAWLFLAPNAGWCVWSAADAALLAFDGAVWRSLQSLDNLPHLGVNTTADASNRLSVKTNTALLAAIAAAEAGSGDVRLQLSKESAARTASVVFSDNYSGRAEFGLVGSDAFKLKVSADGAAWVEAFTIDPASGNLALPRGLTLSGVVAPPQLAANQNDYAPAGLASAAVLQLASDAARSLSGLSGGAEGRVIVLINVGGQPITLLDDGAASAAANRFALGAAIAMLPRQAVTLRYDGTAARWQALAGGASYALSYGAAQALSATQQARARANAGVPNRNYLINPSGEIAQSAIGSQADASYDFDQWLTLTQAAAVSVSSVADAENGTPFMMRSLQAGAAAQRFGRLQWLERLFCRELRGQPVVLSARVRSSVAATLRYAIVEWTGTPDAIAKDVVNDWSSASLTAGGFFTAAYTTVVGTGATALAANVLSDIAPLTGTVSSAMNNLAVLFWTDAAQPQNVTLDIAKVKLERGGVPTPFVAPRWNAVLADCLRYYAKTYATGVAPGTPYAGGGLQHVVEAASNYASLPTWHFPVEMRAAPSVTLYSQATGATGQIFNMTAVADVSGVVNGISSKSCSPNVNNVLVGGTSGLIAHLTVSARL
ncbi:hypothetical protein HNR60_001290 [Rhodopseudomonas rhenobacensis]|uniref:DUF2793 domain-containing protein n=1 Tax=Rhodopseudomonas rhenobacensis TaxID=87461 RepID=A0A7W7Z2M8_9BRAD|nr:DUF2793 domain-containing protein [Rhodopseudomonas rhenobacensis]MBB5046542.1 hypothetical protein [Rhodopseudomonas rhenobacensis]